MEVKRRYRGKAQRKEEKKMRRKEKGKKEESKGGREPEPTLRKKQNQTAKDSELHYER